MLALPDNRKNRYPKFPVYRRVIGYGDSLLEAEKLMQRAVSQAYDIDGIVIDGPGYEYHDHKCIMPLRYPLSQRLRKRFDGYWQACIKQDEESRQGNCPTGGGLLRADKMSN